MTARLNNPAPTHNEHGVFLAMFDLGVLIKGPPGIGKSSLALELIDRKHNLIADDVVQFNRTNTGSNRLIGRCPPMLFNLLAVRDIGVLDISKIYSPVLVKPQFNLDFVIELVNNREDQLVCDLNNPYEETTILAQKFPMQKIFAFPGRNLALIVETVIKNYILYKLGQDAASELIERQQQYL